MGGTITGCSNVGNVTANIHLTGGITSYQVDGTISNCTNSGKIKSNAQGARGISGGIVGVQNGGNINNVYNSGEIITENYSNETVDAIGGIVGLFSTGNINKAYSKGTLIGGDAVGGIIGQKKIEAIIEQTYYYTNQSIKGIDSESDITTEIKPVEDVTGKTEKTTKNIETLEQFLKSEM